MFANVIVVLSTEVMFGFLVFGWVSVFTASAKRTGACGCISLAYGHGGGKGCQAMVAEEGREAEVVLRGVARSAVENCVDRGGGGEWRCRSHVVGCLSSSLAEDEVYMETEVNGGHVEDAR